MTNAFKSHLQIIVFAVLIVAFVVFCIAISVFLACRKRRSARPSTTRASKNPAPVPTPTTAPIAPSASRTDIEKGNSTHTEEADKQAGDPKRTSVLDGFLRWRHQVLYESHPVPELALLPSYKPPESLPRKMLNFVLRKKEVKVRGCAILSYTPRSDVNALVLLLCSRTRPRSRPSRKRSKTPRRRPRRAP